MSLISPSDSPHLKTLFYEGLHEISTRIDELTDALKKLESTSCHFSNIDWQTFVRRSKATLDYVESIVRIHTGLAADKGRALQREREVLRIILELRWYLAKNQSALSGVSSTMQIKIKDLRILAGQLYTSDLTDKWPSNGTTPMLLQSVYTRGNILNSLQFLLGSPEAGQLDVLTAYCDHAHAKLLEILARTIASIRIVVNPDCREVLEMFEPLHQATRLRYNLHSRMISRKNDVIVSSADLKALSYTSQLNAGVAFQREPATDPQGFVDETWSGGIPFARFGDGLSQAPYQTSHVFISLMDARQPNSPTAELYRELSDGIYTLLSTQQIAGYFFRDGHLAFVNVQDLPENLDKEITTLCTLNFNQYVAVIPIQEVHDAVERDGQTREIVSRMKKDVTVIYFSSGSDDNIIQSAKRTGEIASLSNPSIRCWVNSLDSARMLNHTDQFNPRDSEQYICLVHLAGLVGFSEVLTRYQLEQLSIMRYLRETSRD